MEVLLGTGESGLETNNIRSARVSVGKPRAGLLIPACHTGWSSAAVIPSKAVAAGNRQGNSPEGPEGPRQIKAGISHIATNQGVKFRPCSVHF